MPISRLNDLRQRRSLHRERAAGIMRCVGLVWDYFVALDDSAAAFVQT
jgi:hypothetical protein